MNKLFVLLAITVLPTACNRSTPEKRVHRLLTDRIQTLAVAEGSTGGTIAARFTAMPGASAYFKGGVISYWNDTKQSLLDISGDTIARYGVVSEQVARQMAESVRRVTNTHYGIATAGIAGPTGGTPELPVGSVWIAVSSPDRTVSKLFHLKGNRTQVIRKAGTAAIALLEEEILTEKPAKHTL